MLHPGAAVEYELRIVLRDITPPIWRLLRVPGTITLQDLHGVLQMVMGWTNSHLYTFHFDGKEYSDPDPEWEIPIEDATAVTLAALVGEAGSLVYEYDLGDYWLHDITAHEVPTDGLVKGIRCLGGERACPPEDCGGVDGFERLLEALDDSEDDEHQEMVTWAGDFDPERFELAAVNRALGRYRRRYSKRAV